MTLSQEQLEWIVAEVIRRLTAMGAVAGEHGLTATAKGSDLELTERVITLRSIEGRLAGVTRVVVPSRAVITPAVKDELRQRKIGLFKAGKNVCPTKP